MIKRIALIVPTLNEAGTIVKLINAYLALPYQFHIIIADSDSPDNTAQLIKDYFSSNQQVSVLNCAKRGRGASIVFAYRWILEHKLPVTHIAVSDADFSHDPRDFPALFQALDHADVVIGSRYLTQSKVVASPLGRRLFSRAANTLAILLLRVGITDYTNGYRLFTHQALLKLNLSTIDADGFIHLSQEIIQWHKQGLRITEVPTTFVNRVRGKSNFKLKLVIESLFVIVKLALFYQTPKISETTTRSKSPNQSV